MSRLDPRDNLDRIAPLLVLGATVAPWLLGYSSSRAAVADHVAFAFAFGPLAMLILALRPAAVACVLGGLWLAVSPWLLGYAATGDAWGSDLLWGALLAAAAAAAARVSFAEPVLDPEDLRGGGAGPGRRAPAEGVDDRVPA